MHTEPTNSLDQSTLTFSHEMTPTFANPTYYTILNVDPEATRIMIREAYLRMKHMMQSGGDGLYGLGSGDDLARQAAELEEAFSVLNDDHRRAEYDQTLGLQKKQAVQPHRSLPSHLEPSFENSGLDTIQTSRSTLKVIRTRAANSLDKIGQEKIKEILAEADLGDGSLLQRLRECIGVTDTEIQERTKISLEYIRAIESNRFERLPQVVYVKGFMRSYLKYLCIPDSESIIMAFAARLEAWQQGHK
jgi:2-oxo-4-hydroxy-4-carboxy--5-ureidoimidazoline (OHCU) decarboxylase